MRNETHNGIGHPEVNSSSIPPPFRGPEPTTAYCRGSLAADLRPPPFTSREDPLVRKHGQPWGAHQTGKPSGHKLPRRASAVLKTWDWTLLTAYAFPTSISLLPARSLMKRDELPSLPASLVFSLQISCRPARSVGPLGLPCPSPRKRKKARRYQRIGGSSLHIAYLTPFTREWVNGIFLPD